MIIAIVFICAFHSGFNFLSGTGNVTLLLLPLIIIPGMFGLPLFVFSYTNRKFTQNQTRLLQKLLRVNAGADELLVRALEDTAIEFENNSQSEASSVTSPINTE